MNSFPSAHHQGKVKKKKMFSILQKGENKTKQAFTFLYWHLFSYDSNCPSLLLFLHYSCFSQPYHAFFPENVDTWKMH